MSEIGQTQVTGVRVADLMPTFNTGNDPIADFQRLADGIEMAEYLLALCEFAPLSQIEGDDGKTYTIRVNGREYEAPHVHITSRDFAVRVFLGNTPEEVEPDNVSTPSFDKQLRNKRTRQLILDYVRAHHGCALNAWRDSGNPIHAPESLHTTVCLEHPRFVLRKKSQGTTFGIDERLNAHLEEQP